MALDQWNHDSVTALYELPFLQLLSKARSVHQIHFPVDEMELCTLLSIKTGSCPEDCGYCPQSAHFNTKIKKEKLQAVEEVLAQAKLAKQNGAKRFCMGAAWRSPPKKGFEQVLEMVSGVKALGLETCVTVGMLEAEHAEQLKAAGLDFYNHNLDTSPEYYEKIITTRTYEDRLTTLAHVSKAGIRVCCGGIIGMGEARHDRIGLLLQLAKLPTPPESIPINRLSPVAGTPLADTPQIDNFEFIRTIAVTRILMPRAMIRLSAGREQMSDEMQAWCYMAGANSIFYGDVLLTTANPSVDRDRQLLARLGIKTQAVTTSAEVTTC